jgi:hypothetical protein
MMNLNELVTAVQMEYTRKLTHEEVQHALMWRLHKKKVEELPEEFHHSLINGVINRLNVLRNDKMSI